MRRTTLALTFALAFALALGLTGCPSGDGSGGIKRIDQTSLITVITADDAKVLDPHVTSDGGNVKVINQIFETLVRVDPKDVGKLVPELAESWTVTDDAKSITFTIRAGVTFHDGAKLDAAACKLSLDRVRVEGWELPQAPYSSMFSQVESIEADGMTLTVTLKTPVAPVALRNFSMFCASIVSPKVLEESKTLSDVDKASLYVTKNAMGTGAYRVDVFDPAAKITRLTANETCWRCKPSIQTIVFQPVADESARIQYLEKKDGFIVVDDVPRQTWKTLEASEVMDLETWWSLNLCYLGINGIHEATKEPEVRRAIQLAIDRSAIVPHYEGTARPTFSMVAQPMPEYDPALRPEGWTEDVAARRKLARELLERVGAVGRKVTIYFPNQPRPYLPRPANIADAVRNGLKAVGFEAKIQGEDKNKLFPEIKDGQYELVLIGWTTDNGHPDNFYSNLCDGSDGMPSENNVSRVFDAEIHEKILAAQQVVEDGARAKAYQEIERLLQDKVRGWAPLVNTKVALAHSRTISGIEVNDLGQYRFHEAKLQN